MSARFYLFGGFRLEITVGNTDPVELPRLRKARGLLAYLLLVPGRPHPRETLATLFWGDVSDERARDSLSTALSSVRALLPTTGLILEADRYSVQLDLGTAWLDVAAMEAGLAHGAAVDARAAALELYRGELLADWQDEWAIVERERLRRCFLNDGTKLLKDYLAARRWPEAIALAGRLLEQDDLDSSLHELLMSAQLGAGQRETARRHFQQYATLLRTQLGSDPTTTLRELYEGIEAARLVADPAASATGAATNRSAVAPDQLGYSDRIAERAILQAGLIRLRQGEGGLLLVRGEPGIGKTELVEQVLQMAGGLRVARSQGYELESAAPFSMLLRPLNTWLIEDLAPKQVLARLGQVTTATLMQIMPSLSASLPGLAPLPLLAPAEAQMQLAQAIISALLAAGKPPGAPAVLFLDDLHFADTQSLLVLAQLYPRLAATPVLVIASYCAEETKPDSALAQLLRYLEHAGAQTIDVVPLSQQDVCKLIEPLNPDSQLGRWLYECSGGNPFYLTEMVRGLAETGQIAPDAALGGWYLTAGQTVPDIPPVSKTAQATVMQRFYRMSPDAQAVAQVAAASAGQSAFSLLVAVSSLQEQNALRGIEEALDRRFLQQCGVEDCYVITHDLIRNAVYQEISPTRRRYLHSRIATELEVEAGADPDAALINELAYHYDRSMNAAKQREYLWLAAQAAMDEYAYETAANYYQRLLVLPKRKGDEHERIETYRRLGEALRAAGQNEQALQEYCTMRDEAEELGDLLAQAQAWNGIAITRSYLSDPAGSLDGARRAAELARSVGDEARLELGQALVRQGWVYFRAGQPGPAEGLARQALAGSDREEEKALRSSSLNLLGALAELRGKPEQARLHFEQALALAQAVGHRRRMLSLLNNLGENRYWQGDYAVAYDYYRQALALAREATNRDAEAIALAGLGAALAELGDSRAAELELRRAIRISEEGPAPYSLPYAYLALGGVLLKQKRLQEALQAIGRAHSLGRTVADQRCVGIAWRLLAQLLAELHEPVPFGNRQYDAPAAFAESLSIATKNGPAAERARTLRAWARYEEARGADSRAAKLLAEAGEIFTRLKLDHELQQLGRRNMQ